MICDYDYNNFVIEVKLYMLFVFRFFKKKKLLILILI